MAAIRITTILNQKGGTGKSTTAHTLATGLTHRGYKALVVDADAQGNISYTMQADPAYMGLYEAMRGDAMATDAIQQTAQGDIIASSLDLAGADMEFTQTGREYLLREVLEAISANYDHIIIDSPPALGIMSINALTASDDVVIPVCPDIYSLQGLQQLLKNIERVRKYSNPRISVAGMLITRKGNGRALATKELIEAISTRAEGQRLHLYDAAIRETVVIREAQLMRASIFDYAPRAKVAEDYSKFIDEYLKQEAEED